MVASLLGFVAVKELALLALVRTPLGDQTPGRPELEQALRSLEDELLGWLERQTPEPHLPDWADAEEYGL